MVDKVQRLTEQNIRLKTRDSQCQQQYFALSKRAMSMAQAVEDLCRLAGADGIPSKTKKTTPESKNDSHPHDCYVMPSTLPYTVQRDIKMISPKVPVLFEKSHREDPKRLHHEWTPRQSVQATPPSSKFHPSSTMNFNFKPIWR